MRPAPKRGALPTALWLLRSGLWPVPISARTDRTAGSPGKSPIGKAWGGEKATREGLVTKFNAHPGAGIGIASARPRAWSISKSITRMRPPRSSRE